MKKTLLIIASLLFITSTAFSQSKVNINNLVEYGGKMFLPNDERPYTGKVFDLYKTTGNKIFEGWYKNGLMNGKWIYWYEDAIREKQGVFRNGIIVGDWTYYNIDHQKNLTEKETTEQTIETKLDFIISEFRKDLYNNINLINVAADSLADMISEVQYNLDELDRNVSKRFSDVETDIADLEDDFNRNRRKTSQTLSEIQQAITLLQIEVNEIKDKISEKDKRRKN